MKTYPNPRFFIILPFLFFLVISSFVATEAMSVLAAPESQEYSRTEMLSEVSETPTPTITSLPTMTPTPSETLEAPTPTNTPMPPIYSRPQIVLGNYYIGSGSAHPGLEFTLKFQLRNDGESKARNIVITFATGDLIPRKNGGVIVAGTISPGASTTYEQPLIVNSSLQGSSIAVLSMQVAYTDDSGTSFNDGFSLGISLSNTVGIPSSPVFSGPRTSSPTPAPAPQLLVLTYETDEQILKPGTQFVLSMEVLNVGGSTARRVTMVMGGGTSIAGNGSSGSSGNNASGGLSGGSGDYSNFAPIGSSNVQFLGDLSGQGTMIATQRLIVNSNTKPGAYPVRFSFLYTDDKGTSLADDQVITLLVLSPPFLDISLYRPAEPFFVGQPGILPLQIINLDRNSIMLVGKLEVTTAGAQLENNSSSIGYLDPGGFFALDPLVIPYHPGPLTIVIRIDYLDDFNQPQSIHREIIVDVLESSGSEMPSDELHGVDFTPLPVQEESLGQKIKRFLFGFLGFDSGIAVIGASTTSPQFEEIHKEIETLGFSTKDRGRS